MKIKTRLKSGALVENHNQSVAKRARVTVKAGVRAGTRPADPPGEHR